MKITVTAFQQIQLRVTQFRIAVSVKITVLVAEKSEPACTQTGDEI
jgi:hypothetical protein